MYKLLKYPLILIILYFNIKLIYVIAPDKKIKSSTTTKGALFTTVGWLITSEFYSFYTTYFVRYDIFYGSLSSLLVLLIWVYLLSYIFSLGLIINASSYDNNDIIEKEKK
jgi:membrane protein